MVAPTGILAILAPPEYGRSLEHFRVSLNRENALSHYTVAVPDEKPLHTFSGTALVKPASASCDLTGTKIVTLAEPPLSPRRIRRHVAVN
jgi:hypothetical protein